MTAHKKKMKTSLILFPPFFLRKKNERDPVRLLNLFYSFFLFFYDFKSCGWYEIVLSNGGKPIFAYRKFPD